jgi:hypothetical protein
MRSDATKARHKMTVGGIALLLAAAIGSPVSASDMDQMANNLQMSCSNHFRKRPNKPSNDSKKFCSCFAAAFTSTVSTRDLDAAGGVVTPEIQEQFEQAANICSFDIAPDVVQAGKAWIADTN